MFAFILTQAVMADDNHISIDLNGDKRCFETNSIPNHQSGPFRNGTKVKSFDLKLCVTTHPVRRSNPTKLDGSMGVALNGIQFQPNTSGFFDPSTARGHGRNGDKNWSFDLAGAPNQRGLDKNNAHVGRLGTYHYHSLPVHLIDERSAKNSTLVGFAADGFEIHYVGNKVNSGYQLKKGLRTTTPPSGPYDGTYNEDYRFVSSSKNLDQCNMGKLSGKYVYFLTDHYPFVPRCLWGEPSADFVRERGGRQRTARQR